MVAAPSTIGGCYLLLPQPEPGHTIRYVSTARPFAARRQIGEHTSFVRGLLAPPAGKHTPRCQDRHAPMSDVCGTHRQTPMSARVHTGL
eukprot:3940222-Rhodomonas_salina.2